ncbi:histidine phosphatase family protein [Angelakisella massiliensis]|uniref:histidine phosphatase family protein n=1 Tax=Angelakisella massiliensis TaxID=1871018 RepID=UPI0024B23ECA|nr:histidine phosphatase family protein [Angelakisella massiliensis]
MIQKTMDISLIRHGWTEYNHRGAYCCDLDPPLSVYGVRDLALLCKEHPYEPVEQVYCSPLIRCQMTAAIIYPQHEPVIFNQLREMSFGEYDGRLASEVKKEPYYQQREVLGDLFRMPGGESFQEATERMKQGLDLVVKDAMEHQYSRIAVVSHSVVISRLFRACLETPLTPAQLFLPNGMGHLVQWQCNEKGFSHGRLTYIAPIPEGGKRPDMNDSPYISK